MNKIDITPTTTEHPAVEAIRRELDSIGLDVLTGYTIADAMREGAQHTAQKTGGYVDESTSCGLGAAYLSAKARGYVA